MSTMMDVRHFAQCYRSFGRKYNVSFYIKPLVGAAAVAAVLSLTGCSGKKSGQDLFAGTGSPRLAAGASLPKGGGRYHVGKPYEINGKKFYPREVASYDRSGTASWYGPKFHRRMTSNGEWFDMNDLTAAHTTLPLPSYVKVTNVENGKQAVLRVNDRGPFAHDRLIDLSRRSAEILGVKGKGTAQVRVVYLGKAPLDHDGTHLAAMNKKYLSSGNYTRVASAMNYSRSPVMVAQANTAQPKPRTVSSSGDGYFIQAASFSSPDNAMRAKANLREIGPVNILPVDTGERTLYRVTVGPLKDAARAEMAIAHAAEMGMPGARIVTP
ncbi:MAG: septal ring lytic transglycosylase RlpA family protein [Hyphomicrobiales bacterium]